MRFEIQPLTEANKGKNITLTSVFAADKVGFSLNSNRNPMFSKNHKFAINSKGLLTSARTEDTGELDKVVAGLASSIGALSTNLSPGAGLVIPKSNVMGNPMTTGQSGSEAGNFLTSDEYDYFVKILNNTSLLIEIPDNKNYIKENFPNKSAGPFMLEINRLQPINSAGYSQIKHGINAYLSSLNNKNLSSDEILAHGIVARSTTNIQFSYKISILKERINDFRKNNYDNSSKSLEAVKNVENYKSSIEDIKELNNAIKNENNQLMAIKNSIHEHIANLKENSTTTDTIKKLHELAGKHFNEVCWEFYTTAMAENDEKNKKATAAKLYASIHKVLDSKIVENNNNIKNNNQLIQGAKNSIIASESDIRKSTLASEPITLTQKLSTLEVVDTSRVQILPMYRSIAGTTLSNYTLDNGLVSNTDFTEPGAVATIVSLPANFINSLSLAITGRYNNELNMIKKKDEVLKAQEALIKSQQSLLNTKTSSTTE